MVDAIEDFDRLIARDRESSRLYSQFCLAVLLVGIAVAALGFLLPWMPNDESPLGPHWLILGGGAIIALGMVPLRQYRNSRRRIAELRTLRERWHELLFSAHVVPADWPHLRGLVRQLYGHRAD